LRHRSEWEHISQVIDQKIEYFFFSALREEEEEEGMDIAGVNLQEETAHFLPQSVGETLRTCKDEVFLDTQVLKQRVAAIGEFLYRRLMECAVHLA